MFGISKTNGAEKKLWPLPPSRHWEEDYQGTFIPSEPRTELPHDERPVLKTIIVGMRGKGYAIFKPAVGDLRAIPYFADMLASDAEVGTVPGVVWTFPDEDPVVFEALDHWMHVGQMLAVPDAPTMANVRVVVRLYALAEKWGCGLLMEDALAALDAWGAQSPEELLATHDVPMLCQMFHAASAEPVKRSLAKRIVALLNCPRMEIYVPVWAALLSKDPEVAARVIELSAAVGH